MKNITKLYNFGYDTIDANAYNNRNGIALRFIDIYGRTLEISKDDFRHHSDIAAEFLRFKGVKSGDSVVISGLENMFEPFLILTALHKLYATPIVVMDGLVSRYIQTHMAKAVILNVNSPAIRTVNNMIADGDVTDILRVSVGYPYQDGWKDVHIGSWKARHFATPQQYGSQHSTALITNLDGIEKKFTMAQLRTMEGDDVIARFYRTQCEELTTIIDAREK